MRDYFRRLQPRHWAWAHVLAVVGIWWPLFIILTPPQFVSTSVDPIILLVCMWIAVFGAFLKIGGFLSSQQPGKIGVYGVSVELVGLILSALGPVSYLAVYISAVSEGSSTLNGLSTGFILAYGICALYAYRAIIIVPRFLKEAHDPSKE